MRYKKQRHGACFPYMRKKLYIKPLRKWVNYLWKQCH